MRYDEPCEFQVAYYPDHNPEMDFLPDHMETHSPAEVFVCQAYSVAGARDIAQREHPEWSALRMWAISTDGQHGRPFAWSV